MKKLFILTPLMLLTSIIYSADMVTLMINPFIGGGEPVYRRPLNISVDVDHDTLESLAQKIDTDPNLRADHRFDNHVVEFLAWQPAGRPLLKKHFRSAFTNATLRAMGIVDKERHIMARMIKGEEEEIKEPDLD